MAPRRAVGRALGPALIALFLPPVLWYHEDFRVHMCGHPTQRLSFVYTVTNSLLLPTPGTGDSYLQNDLPQGGRTLGRELRGGVGLFGQGIPGTL